MKTDCHVVKFLFVQIVPRPNRFFNDCNLSNIFEKYILNK